MTKSRRRRILRALAVATAMVGLVGAIAPSAVQAATKGPATHKGDTYVYPSTSLARGTQEILAYKRSLKVMGKDGLVHPNSCPADPGFDFSAKAPSHISAVLTVYGDPGVYITISLTAGLTAQATISVAVTGGVSAVIASASTTYGIAFAVSITASVTYGGGYQVPATAPHYGYLGAGASSDTFNWAYGHYQGAACTWVVTVRGSGNGAIHLPYFWKGVA